MSVAVGHHFDPFFPALDASICRAIGVIAVHKPGWPFEHWDMAFAGWPFVKRVLALFELRTNDYM
jgi:hypothetical protein